MMGEWRKALTCYEGLLNYENDEDISYGYIYERAGQICLDRHLNWEG